MAGPAVVYIDGVATQVAAGQSLLEACDGAGRYVPRLCTHPALGHEPRGGAATLCGLCAVRLADGSIVQACATEATAGAEVTTDDAGLRAVRAERLASLLAWHPHFCLSCPDREGCSRDACVHGLAAEARCCDKLGTCEFGAVVQAVDPMVLVPRREVVVSREATAEGRIRREPGLCVACERCVRICSTHSEAGDALEMAEAIAEETAKVARPKQGTLRASGCTFCGLCVLVCPTGALSAPGADGVKWLAARREKHALPAQTMPPAADTIALPEGLARVPEVAGVFTLFDGAGRVLRIGGVHDLQKGVGATLAEALRSPYGSSPDGSGPGGAEAFSLRFEVEPLYTQRESELLAQYSREHGQLPPGNDLGDDLFDDDLE